MTTRRRRGGNVGIRRFCFLPDFQARWKEWKTRFGFLSFPRFPRGVISTALFIFQLPERSDAAEAVQEFGRRTPQLRAVAGMGASENTNLFVFLRRVTVPMDNQPAAAR